MSALEMDGNQGGLYIHEVKRSFCIICWWWELVIISN